MNGVEFFSQYKNPDEDSDSDSDDWFSNINQNWI